MMNSSSSSSTELSLMSGAIVGPGIDPHFTNLLDISPDHFYSIATTNTSSKSHVPKIVHSLDLDITRISDRIIVMGRCWNHRTDKATFRNNINEIALFLNTRYSPTCKYFYL